MKILDISCISTKCHINIGIVLFITLITTLIHYVINNCINSLHSGLAIMELCMARDGGKLENFDCLTFIDLLCVS